MIQTIKKITIKDLTTKYVNTDELGATTMSGNLNIRPAYQREFIYNDKQRNEVIKTLLKSGQLGLIQWMKNDQNSFEVMDGQQRIISICEYITGNFSIESNKFHNLSQEKQKEILEQELIVNICEGTTDEKLEWFQTINIAGSTLTQQELYNSSYTGTWLSDAKEWFSKRGCQADNIGNEDDEKLLKGSSIRQDYLSTALKWISHRDRLDGIKDYMSEHHHDIDAHELWDYFRAVVEWVKRTFEYRKEMKGIDWGILYNQFKDSNLNKNELESKIKKLMMDEDVTKKSGIYTYILTEDKKFLSIRAFTDKNKREVYDKQNGICIKCNKTFTLKEMQADHIVPWSKGGKTITDNCQMLCQRCNAKKSNN